MSRTRRTVIYTNQILAWADAFKERHGRWPLNTDGAAEGSPNMTWCAVDQALVKGHRGLSPGQSLAKLLLIHRKKRHSQLLPDLTVAQILLWADAHHTRTGSWPLDVSGEIAGASGETWMGVQKALCKGRRGLKRSTLAQLLESYRGVRNHLTTPLLTVAQILGWADAHHEQTGSWPVRMSGVVTGTDETWQALDAALDAGSRGLPGGDSLPRLLARYRAVRNVQGLPSLSPARIRAWAKAHKRRTGHWPRVKEGNIHGTEGETWAGVNQALMVGRRGLPGGSSLFQLLRERRLQPVE